MGANWKKIYQIAQKSLSKNKPKKEDNANGQKNYVCSPLPVCMSRVCYSSLLAKNVPKNSCSTSLDDYLDEFENGEVEKGDDTKRNDELEDARKYSVPKISMI